jgi:hypothetical protein
MIVAELDRRKFLAALGSTVAALGSSDSGMAAPLGHPSTQPEGMVGAAGQSVSTPAKEVPVIGIQIGAISFLDEGTEKVLDILQEKGGVDTLFIASFTYGNGAASRMIPGHLLPDHGVQQYDDDFHGGNYATPHPQYYQDSVLKNLKAPDHGNVDILEMSISPT